MLIVRVREGVLPVLEPDDNLPVTLSSVPLCSRYDTDFLETLLLLLPIILLPPTVCLLLRVIVPAAEGTEVFLLPIVLPIRPRVFLSKTREGELIRLPELVDVRPLLPELTAVGFLLLTEMLVGLRTPEAVPGRVVTGWMDVTLPDGRTLLLIVTPEPWPPAGELVTRSDELRGAALLLELLRTEDLDVLALVEGSLERDEVETFAVVLVEDCRAFGAGEDFLTSSCFLELLSLDLLLLLDFFSAKAGSKKSIKTRSNVTKAILTFLMYFGVNIIRLLS